MNMTQRLHRLDNAVDGYLIPFGLGFLMGFFVFLVAT